MLNPRPLPGLLFVLVREHVGQRQQHKTEGIFTEHCVVIVEGKMQAGVFQASGKLYVSTVAVVSNVLLLPPSLFKYRGTLARTRLSFGVSTVPFSETFPLSCADLCVSRVRFNRHRCRQQQAGLLQKYPQILYGTFRIRSLPGTKLTFPLSKRFSVRCANTGGTGMVSSNPLEGTKVNGPLPKSGIFSTMAPSLIVVRIIGRMELAGETCGL